VAGTGSALTANAAQAPASGIYRPPQWAAGPAMVSITQVPTQGQANSNPNAPGALPAQIQMTTYSQSALLTSTAPTAPTFIASGSTQITYVFDAVLELDHEQRLEVTHHPVQTGADISSHAYLMPPRVVMTIGMSDAMDAYASGANNKNTAGNAAPDNVSPFGAGGLGGSGTGKSVNAYQTLIKLQAARQPLTVTTRLRTYTNMVIASVSPREDYKTIAGLRARVEFQQVYTATTAAGANTPGSGVSAAVVGASARPDATVATTLGQVGTSVVPATTQKQFQQIPQSVPNNAYTMPSNDLNTDYVPVQVPGAGSYASTPGQQALP
jgi:hypothetical protein